MTGINLTFNVVTLNINGLNTPIKVQVLAAWVKTKTKTMIPLYLFTKPRFKLKDTQKKKNKKKKQKNSRTQIEWKLKGGKRYTIYRLTK